MPRPPARKRPAPACAEVGSLRRHVTFGQAATSQPLPDVASSIQITLNTYAHLLPEMAQQAADAFGAALKQRA
jgi:hypothetical protein